MLSIKIKCTAIILAVLLVTLCTVAIPNLTSAQVTTSAPTQASLAVQALNKLYLGQLNFSQAVSRQSAMTTSSNEHFFSGVYTGNLNGEPATVHVRGSFVAANNEQTGYVYNAVFSGSLNYQITDSTNETATGNISTISSYSQIRGDIYNATSSGECKMITTDVVTKQVKSTILIDNATGSYSETIQGSTTLALNQTTILSGIIAMDGNLMTPAGLYTVYFGSAADSIDAITYSNTSDFAMGNSTLLGDYSVTKAAVVFPDGKAVDPYVATYGDYRTGWYGFATLTAIIVQFAPGEWNDAALVIAVVVSAAAASLNPIVGAVVAVVTAGFVWAASNYQASDGYYYLYVEMVVVDLIVQF